MQAQLSTSIFVMNSFVTFVKIHAKSKNKPEIAIWLIISIVIL